MEKDRYGTMDYSLTEDDYTVYVEDAIRSDLSRKDCEMATTSVNYADKESTIITRDVSKEFQEPPMVRISHMLNDEAPDNFLSSAAIEKNIFSDDDEFGLHRLKRSNKNLVNPTWDDDLNTEEVVKRESTLDMDYVNLPPLPPPPPPKQKPTCSLTVKRENWDDNKNNEPVVLFETTTDPVMKVVEGLRTEKRISEHNPMPSCSSGIHEHDTEESISSVMNDHNYISQKSKINEYTTIFQSMLKDFRDGKVELALDETLKCYNEASLIAAFLKEKSIGMDLNDNDDDASSTASTEPYIPDNDRTIDDVVMSTDISGKTKTSGNICKEELIIEETDALDTSGNICDTDNKEKFEENSRPASPILSFEQEKCNSEAEKLPGEAKSSTSEKSKTTEESSSISILFSENRSEPNEFFDSEDMFSTDHDHVSDNNSEPVASSSIQKSDIETYKNPKIIELKEFGSKLIELCEKTNSDENLQEIMDKLMLDFRKIVDTDSRYVDASVQTEKYISKARQSKMNEKAKNSILNAVSSDSSSSDDDDGDRIEKSPSYSDLSGRASSEEFLNTELDEVPAINGVDREEKDEVQDNGDDHSSVSDGIDLSENASNVDDDGLDLSKYEEFSERTDGIVDETETEQDNHDDHHTIEKNGAMQNSELKDSQHLETNGSEIVKDPTSDIEMEDKMDDGIRTDQENMSIDDVGEVYDGDKPDDDFDDDDNEDLGDNEADDEDDDDDDDDSQQMDAVNNDEKLKADPVVVVDKLSETDLEVFYDEVRDKEIDKLLKFSGLIKRKAVTYEYPDRSQKPIRSSKTTKLLEILKDADNDICSDDSNSDVEEPVVTERDFLNQCNLKAKHDFLKATSSDSEIGSKPSDDDDDMGINSNLSSSNDSLDQLSIVDKFLKKISEKTIETATTTEAAVTPVLLIEGSEAAKSIIVNGSIGSPTEKENECVIEPEITIHLNDSADELNLEDIGDGENTEPNGKTSEKNNSLAEPAGDKTDNNDRDPKPSTSRGYGLMRSLLEEKEIDLDAISAIGKKDNSSTTDAADRKSPDCDILDNPIIRRPASTKSLETLFEDAKRRLNAKSTTDTATNIVTVNVDSDSDLEEIGMEPETQTRTIKPMLRKDQLAGETRVAQSRENERIKRLEKKKELVAKMIKEHEKDGSMLSENELILDYNSETKSLIRVHPEIVKHLKDHQIDGIKFMYDNCYGSVDNLKKHPGSGCILAHCMGLGKTLQLIALLHTVITHKELNTSKILVLCPKSTVMNWADEIRRWLGPFRMNNLKLFSFLDISGIQEKLGTLQEWSCSGQPGFRKAGCLLMGYEAFRVLVFYHLYKKKNVSASQVEKIKDKIRETLLQPDLVICDEGHIIKNRKSATSLAVSELNTPRRIILTGTPIQNNLKEYYAMVNFIKPKFLGTEKEFANLYANPIKNGQHKDSNKRDIKIMKQRSFVLHKKLSKFVQRREAALLKTFLPMKYEYVLFIPMTDVQNKLYEYFLETSSKREGSKGKNLIPDYTCLRKIWTHPRVLENAWKNAMQKSRRENKKSPVREPNSDDEVPDDVYDTQTGILSVTDDWWRPLLSDDNLKSILPSNKLQTMFEILRMCEENGEKCLIFSAFVAVLDCVEYFMNQINNQSQESRTYGLGMMRGPWVTGKDYYRLDGKTPKTIRHEMVKRFNDPSTSRARVFLISAKAGGQGINLIGANRVILLDTSWNPSNDQQNIFRVFRLGQKRRCYVYRLLAMGTMEEKVYSRSVTKQAMSFRVVDEQQIERHYSMAELTELYTLTKPDYQNRPVPNLPQDIILASLLRNTPHLVYKYHEHDSLLENKLEQELSEQEKADAWDAYEKDLQYSQNPDFLTSLNSMPAMMQNPGSYLPPSVGYPFQQDRNYPLSYGNMPQGLMAGLGYSTTPLMDMFNMFPSYPGANTSLMPPQSYTSGGLPSTSSTIPMNLPAFSTLQNMVQSTGMSTMPSYTTPYSTMANLSDSSNLMNMLSHYESAMNLNANGNISMDSRANLARLPLSTPSINPLNDMQNSPYPPSLVVPTTTAESIPTSVIMKPPQAHALSQQAFATPPPPHHHTTPKLPPSLPLHQMQAKLPPPLPQSLPPQPQLQPQSQTQPKPPHLPHYTAATQLKTQQPPQYQPPSTTNAKQQQHQPPSLLMQNGNPKSHVTVKSQLTNALSGASIQNRNSSPITVTRSSPQPKTTNTSSFLRTSNMGIVYPEINAATITPVPPTSTTSTISHGNESSTTGPTVNTNISVRSVSSINNNTNVRPAASPTAVRKSPMLPNMTTSFPSNIGSLKQNSTIGRPNSSAINPANPSFALNKQMINANVQKSPIAKPTPPSNTAVITQKHASNASSPVTPLQQTSQKHDRTNNNKFAMNNKPIQFLNNVQLTKVPNKPATTTTTSKTNYQTPPQLTQTVGGQTSSTVQSGTNSLITKSRAAPGSSITMMPVQSNSSKMLQNKNQSVVPTLAPLSSKVTTRIVPGAPILTSSTRNSTQKSSPATAVSVMKNAKPALSTVNSAAKNPSVIRVGSVVTKPFQPGATIKRTIRPTTAASLSRNGTSMSLPNLSKLTPNTPTINQQSRMQNSISSQFRSPNTASIVQQPRPQPTSVLTNQQLSQNSSPGGKSSVVYLPVDNINKFAIAGITIAPGRKTVPTSNQSLLLNRPNATSTAPPLTISGSAMSNTSNAITVSKVTPTSLSAQRKRPASTVFDLPENSPISVQQVKKPRTGQSAADRNLTESLMRVRSSQNLTILPRNMSQANQRLSKDGKLTDVVEID